MLVNNLIKVRELSRNDRRLLFQSVLLLPIIHGALMFLGYHRFHRVMENLSPLRPTAEPVSEAESIHRAQQIAQIVSIAAQHGIYRATCLRQSLLVWWFLRRAGFPSQICFGVRMLDGRLEAHAWVEYRGVVVNDLANIHGYYQALVSAPPATEAGL